MKKNNPTHLDLFTMYVFTKKSFFIFFVVLLLYPSLRYMTICYLINLPFLFD